MKRLVGLSLLLIVGLAFADTPPPIGIQTLFKTAPKPNPAGTMPRLIGMQGSTLVQLPLSSAKPALATTSTAGIVKVGTGLAMDSEGRLNNTGIAGVASFNGRGGAVTPGFSDYSVSMIKGLKTVAKTGSYNDLTSKPVIPAAQIPADWNQATTTAPDYIKNKPTVPTALSQLTQDATHRTVTDAEKATWNTSTASVNSVNDKTGTVTLTATDVGADPLGSATSVQTNLNAHTGATNNPHSVTKAQVGLGNVDNTSDANKPISTATQAALDLKANTSSLGTAASKDVPASGNASATQVVMGSDTRLAGDLRSHGAVLDGVTDDYAAVQAYINSIAGSRNYTLDLSSQTMYLSAPLQLPPGIGIKNGTIKGSIFVGTTATEGAYPADFRNPTIESIHFEQSSLVSNTYAIKYQMVHYAGNVRGCSFTNYDKAIYVPQITVTTTTTQQVHRLTIEDCKYNNVNYFLKSEKPTTTMYGLADVHVNNSNGQANITNIRLEGVDGFILDGGTLFQPGYSTASATKENNVYIDYANWITLSNAQYFESGLDAIYLSHVRNVSVIGGHIAWSGQRVPSAGIRMVNGDTAGQPTNIATIKGITIQQPSLSGIMLDANTGAVNISGVVVKDAGYVVETAASLPPVYYYGSTDLTTLSHYGIYVDSQAQNNSVVGNMTPDNDNYISAFNRNSFAALNYDSKRNAITKLMPLTLSGTETTFSAAGVTSVNLSQTSPTTISSITNGVEGQKIDFFAFNGNTTFDFTGTSLKGNKGVDLTLASGDVMSCTYISSNWRCLSVGPSITDSTSTSSSTIAASATAVKAAYDLANGKPSLTSTAPNMDGVASAGSGVTAARVDHVHPADTTKAPVDNPTFTTGINTPIVNSTALDGEHMVKPYNTTAYSGTCSKGMVQTVGTPATLQVCTADGTWGAVTGAVSSVNGNTGAITTSQLGAYYPSGTDVAIADGGTGASTAAAALANLGGIGGTVGSTADRIPVASGTGGSTLKASGATIDPTTGMMKTQEQSGVRDVLGMGDGSLAHWAGWTLAGTLTGDYYLALPTSAPSAGQIMITGTPTTVTVDGVSSTVVPVTFTSANTAGTYTPTYTAGTTPYNGVNSFTPGLVHYSRSGNEVHVDGFVTADITANAGNATVFYISLPPSATSDLTSVDDCGGVVTSNGVSGSFGGYISADTTGNRARVQYWNTGATGGSMVFSFSFTYTVK